MKVSWRLAALGVLSVVLLGGCTSHSSISSPSSSPSSAVQISLPAITGNIPDELDNSQWKLITIDETLLSPGAYISLYFVNGKIWSHTGLNTLEGSYSIRTPGTIVFSEAVWTLMSGPWTFTTSLEIFSQQETDYQESFRESMVYKLVENHLEINDTPGKKSLVFERLPEYAMKPAKLIGTSWQLFSLDGKPAAFPAILDFKDSNQAIVQAGSLEDEITYEASGDIIHFLSLTRKHFDPSQESSRHADQLSGYLSFMAGYRLTEYQLELFTAQGRTLVFKPSIAVETNSFITIRPFPGDYLTNSQDVSSQVLLIDVQVNSGITEKEYFGLAPTGIVKIGEPILVVSGRIQNKHPENKEIAMWAAGYDEVGNQVSWTLDAAHIIGQIGIHLEKDELGQFTLHLNTAQKMKGIRIFANNYAIDPP
jgi:hypothetical protein